MVGVSMAVSLAPARDLLEEMNKVVVEQLERRGVGGEEPEAEAAEDYVDPETGEAVAAAATPGGAVAAAVQAGYVGGKISTRKDAVKALEEVCDYYESNEPSSPLPLLIRRAQRLASKNFLDILRDLAPDAVAQAEALGGCGSTEAASEAVEESEESSSW